MKKSRTNIALAFHYVRIYRKISQRTMANLLRIHQSSVSRIEQGRIRPTQYTIDKLLKIADKTLDELIVDALAARELFDRMEEIKKPVSQQQTEIDYQDLSPAEKEYLEAKWTMMVHETDRSMRRKIYRHGRTVQKMHQELQKKRHFSRESQKEYRMLQYLKESNAPKHMIGKQQNRLTVWADLGSKLKLKNIRKTPVELILEKSRLEEMQLIRNYRAGMLAKLGALAL